MVGANSKLVTLSLCCSRLHRAQAQVAQRAAVQGAGRHLPAAGAAPSEAGQQDGQVVHRWACFFPSVILCFAVRTQPKINAREEGSAKDTDISPSHKGQTSRTQDKHDQASHDAHKDRAPLQPKKGDGKSP